MKKSALLSIVPALLCLGWSISRAEVITVEVSNANLTTYEAADTSDEGYHTLALTLPGGIQGVSQAWLEVVMDVSVSVMSGFSDPAPVLEVFMLKNAVSGGALDESLETTRLPMSRPVAVGVSRLVRIDVTEFIQRILIHPEANYGIVIGSVTGKQHGHFDPKINAISSGNVARLVLIE